MKRADAYLFLAESNFGCNEGRISNFEYPISNEAGRRKLEGRISNEAGWRMYCKRRRGRVRSKQYVVMVDKFYQSLNYRLQITNLQITDYKPTDYRLQKEFINFYL